MSFVPFRFYLFKTQEFWILVSFAFDPLWSLLERFYVANGDKGGILTKKAKHATEMLNKILFRKILHYLL